MKKVILIFSVFLFLVAGYSNVYAGIIGLEASDLNVSLSITDLGDSYKYDFNFINTDDSEIWHFFVYTTGTVYNGSTSFPHGLLTNTPSSGLAGGLYDPINLDSSLNYFHNMWYGNDSSEYATYGLAIGGTGSLSFEANFYTNSFLYGYETVNSGYAYTNNSRSVESVGIASTRTSVPEPATMLLLGTGLVGLAGFCRKLKK